MPDPPTLAEFGHGTMTVEGKPARGARKLLAVLVNYSDNLPINNWHEPIYYRELAFGNLDPPFTTNPVNPASLTEYFRENSYGRFWFEKVDLIRNLNMGTLGLDPGPFARVTAIMRRLAEVVPGDLVDAATGADHEVAADELVILLVENFPDAYPGNSPHEPVQVSIGSGATAISATVRTSFAGGGPRTPFFQLAHEISHIALGTVDMYNSGGGNYSLTLMSGYDFVANDQVAVHLDVWHKLMLGWAEPRVFRLEEPGIAELWEGPDGAILLWGRGAEEYFLVERRRPNAPGQNYDSGVSGDGAVIWRVQAGVPGGVVALGRPGLLPGGSGVWPTGSQTPYLVWGSDEREAGVSISVSDPGNGHLQVKWNESQDHLSTARHLRLFHGGSGQSGVGGLVDQGVFYGITSDGHLEWNRYNGNGESGASHWDHNTGHLIGEGFSHMLHALGGGNGVLIFVHPNGSLYWFCYLGKGEEDPSGHTGWDTHSGTVIGTGWQSFVHVVALPQSRPGGLIQLLAVDGTGAMRWYGYRGHGESQPDDRDWHPNSGNLIDKGWRGIRTMHGNGEVIFAEDFEGIVRWYSYEGMGKEAPNGETGWHPNSGNEVNGPFALLQVFGGMTDVGGFGHVITGVDITGGLYWYRYNGHGESDVSGVAGWDPRSPIRIATGW